MGGVLATIGIFSLIGAFVDFVLGKTGEAALRKKLESWWLRLSYINWRNFGVAEALVAAEVMENIFGRMFSVRRLKISIGISIFFVALRCVTPNPNEYTPLEITSTVLIVLYLIFQFNFSLSLTIFVTKAATYWMKSSFTINVLICFLLILFQYFLLVFGPAIVGFAMWLFTMTIIQVIPSWLSLEMPWVMDATWKDVSNEIVMLCNISMSHLASPFSHISRIVGDLDALSWDNHDFWVSVGALPNLIGIMRLSLFLLFILSCLLYPLQAPLMAVFARVVESDKPIFTLVCGGIAALVQAGQQAISLWASAGVPPHS